MTRAVVFTCLVIFAVAAGLPGACADSEAGLVRYVDAVRHPDCDCALSVEMTDTKPGGNTEKSTYRVFLRRKRDEPGYDVLLYCESPSRMEGRMMLFRGNRVWYRQPGWMSPVRMPVGFLGRRAFLAAVFQASFEKHYRFREAGRETVRDGEGMEHTCRKLVMSDPVPHYRFFPGRAEYWVDSRSGEFVRGDYYGRNGKLLRIVHYGGNREVLGEIRPMDSTIRHMRLGESKTRVRILNFRGTKIPASWMEPESMGRLRWNPGPERFEIRGGKGISKFVP